MIRDPFARREVSWQIWFLLGPICIVLSTYLALTGFNGCSRHPEVVLYAAQDRTYAEPILREFEQATGLRVRTVYDSEAVKTVGLANRLLTEQAHPQCDVFWGNEELRTRQLAARGVFRATNGWVAFGYRSRRIAVTGSTASVPEDRSSASTPRSLLDLTNSIYRRRVALAYPMFGTTATHFLALRQHWGEAGWLAWCRALAANEPFIVDGNSVSVQFVLRGEASVALTDSDDIVAAIREHKGTNPAQTSRPGPPLQALPIDADTLLIPNTVGVVRQAPHPEAAQLLFAYLQSEAVLGKLVAAGALEGARPPAEWPGTVQPDWNRMLAELEIATDQMKTNFRK